MTFGVLIRVVGRRKTNYQLGYCYTVFCRNLSLLGGGAVLRKRPILTGHFPQFFYVGPSVCTVSCGKTADWIWTRGRAVLVGC